MHTHTCERIHTRIFSGIIVERSRYIIYYKTIESINLYTFISLVSTHVRVCVGVCDKNNKPNF